MNILVTGASGLVGSALVPFLTSQGHRVVKLVRFNPRSTGELANWNPQTGEIDLGHAGALDAVVHLAGEPIGRRWTSQRRISIRESRIQGTKLLSETLAQMPRPPRVLVSASAIGFYGDRGDEELDEQSPAGQGFLAEVCREWESASESAHERGIRVVFLRLGIVLSSRGGALAKMLPVFKFGLGGRLGDGKQHWSWIALEDVLGAILQALGTDELAGPVNVVAPQPATNRDFTKAVGQVLHRPTIFGVPRFAVELLFGEMGREAMLASTRVSPAKLLASGFLFQYPELEPALRHLLRPDED